MTPGASWGHQTVISAKQWKSAHLPFMENILTVISPICLSLVGYRTVHRISQEVMARILATFL